MRDILKEGMQLAAYSTKHWLGIWQGKPSQANRPVDHREAKHPVKGAIPLTEGDDC
jgi:hypothetical protein